MRATRAPWGNHGLSNPVDHRDRRPAVAGLSAPVRLLSRGMRRGVAGIAWMRSRRAGQSSSQGSRLRRCRVQRHDGGELARVVGGVEAGGEGDHVHLGRREVIHAQRQRRCRRNQGGGRRGRGRWRCRRGGARWRRSGHHHRTGRAQLEAGEEGHQRDDRRDPHGPREQREAPSAHPGRDRREVGTLVAHEVPSISRASAARLP